MSSSSILPKPTAFDNFPYEDLQFSPVRTEATAVARYECKQDKMSRQVFHIVHHTGGGADTPVDMFGPVGGIESIVSVAGVAADIVGLGTSAKSSVS
jgi:hypothetical protein